MSIQTEVFDPDKTPFPFEGVIFSGRMYDKKLGAYCKNKKMCLIAGAGTLPEGRKEILALGRWDGEKYSAANRVPPPFIVRSSGEAAGKSSVTARNIVNRLSKYMEEGDAALFREYLMEMERCGVAYVPG